MFRRRPADDSPPSFLDRLASLARIAFWALLIYLVVAQFIGSGAPDRQRAEALNSFQQARKSRLIALIHRQDRVSFLGVPVGSFINIEDSEAVLRAIRLTPDDQPIDLILHTPGGLVLAAEQIARALIEHKGKVTVFVPHYAMSGGTLIALAADEIVMDPNAVLGPVDPQVGGAPAASILRVLEQKPVERINDSTLVLADVAKKAQAQVQTFVTELLAQSGQMSQEQAAQTGRALTEGRWTHDYPINTRVARDLGLRISTQMPREVYAIMDLYPQAPARRPSVLYIEPPRTPRDVPGSDGPAAVPQRPESR